MWLCALRGKHRVTTVGDNSKLELWSEGRTFDPQLTGGCHVSYSGFHPGLLLPCSTGFYIARSVVRHSLAPWARCARFMHAQCFRVFIYISYVLRAVSLNQAIRYIPSLPLSVTASMSISSKYLCHKVIKYLLHVKVVVFFQLWLLVENGAVLSGSLPQLDFEKSCVICFKIIYCIKGIC